jgi:hypothetical protein
MWFIGESRIPEHHEVALQWMPFPLPLNKRIPPFPTFTNHVPLIPGDLARGNLQFLPGWHTRVRNARTLTSPR